MAQITGIAHVELSVRDLEASERWYSELLGMRRVFHEADPGAGIVASALFHRETGIVLALTQHDLPGEKFVVNQPGLDHLSFAVADRDELRRWEARLAEVGADYTPLEEWSHGAAVTARDPDGIAIEFYVRGAAGEGT